MKKSFLYLVTVSVFLFIVPMQIKAEVENTDTPELTTATVELNETKALLDRVNEIKTMDVSVLSPAERKELRKELRAIKSELKVTSEASVNQHGNGVYLSVGAIIIIVLLLILIL